jgi:hypothetical protein
VCQTLQLVPSSFPRLRFPFTHPEGWACRFTYPVRRAHRRPTYWIEPPRREKVQAAQITRLRVVSRSPEETLRVGDITPLHLSRAMDRARQRHSGTRRVARTPRSWRLRSGIPIVSFVLPIDPPLRQKCVQIGSITGAAGGVKQNLRPSGCLAAYRPISL